MLAYSTGTFDGCHPGQLRFLRNCRSMLPEGVKLIIGLVTDELAVKQKRKPLHTYEHRRAMLLSLKGLVDDVVPHTGDDKKTAWEKMHFTHCLIGDEYYGSQEYKQIEDFVKVYYVPRHPADHFSSSEATVQTCFDNVKKFTILAQGGPGGPIYIYRDKPESVVIKTIKVSQREFDGLLPRWRGPMSTANVYSLPIPNPRNFKRLGEVHKYPNLPGVNSYREIAVQSLIKSFDWCTTMDVQKVSESDGGVKSEPERPDWSHLNADKTIPRETYFLYQRFAGESMYEWVEKNQESEGFIGKLQTVVDRVKQICKDDLPGAGLVHGDLHHRNICILERPEKKGPVPLGFEASDALRKSKIDVALIDWGWCLHRSFQMDSDEREYFEQCIDSGWDWCHFKDSMAYAYIEKPWFAKLKF